MDALTELVAQVANQVSIRQQVELRPWPQCEALLTLSDVVTEHGLRLATTGHDGTDYGAGDRLVVQVRTPDFPSYLYVLYIEANGEAVPLYKPPGLVPQALPAGTVVTLGDGADPRRFRVQAPFGNEMLIAVAAASPLFTDGMPPQATEREYLTALRKTLEYKPDPTQPDRVVDGAAIALTTHDVAPSPTPPTPAPAPAPAAH